MKEILYRLEKLIEKTPTSKLREDLTAINILLRSSYTPVSTVLVSSSLLFLDIKDSGDEIVGIPHFIMMKNNLTMSSKFKVGDWVKWLREEGKGFVGKIIKHCPLYDDSWMLKEDGEYSSCRENYLILATPEEISKAQEQVISVGGKFDVIITKNEVYHNGANITDYVKDLIDLYSPKPQMIGGYAATVKDIIFSKTGCENQETKLSDWIIVYNLIKD